jgi:dTDP-4-amino-4,6-dideoxy-D-galactose acyltransferase
MSVMEFEICEYLSWDSDFFQLRIARLIPNRLTPESMSMAEQWSRENRIDCLFFIAEVDDALTVRLAEEHDFRLTDVRVTMDARLEDLPKRRAPECVRRFRAEDVPALQALARVSHRETRFYFDPGFPDESCDRLYDTWIKRSCEGWADAVFVADLGSGPVGYSTISKAADGCGDFRLLAVDRGARGRGLGEELTSAVAEWCRDERLEKIRLVTQGRNQAMRLFTKFGLRVRTIQLWYHRWFSHPN